MPPLSLITIAAYFPEDYRLRLVDLNIEPLRDEDICWADQAYVSAMIVQKASFEKVVAACNRLNTTVIAGGPYPTSSHAEIMGVDHFVLGEVENTLPGFIAAMEEGTARQVYPSTDKPILTDSRVPRFDLLNMRAYASMSIQYSRGCPFKCEFCDIWSVYGNRPRLKSPAGVTAELEALYASGWSGAGVHRGRQFHRQQESGQGGAAAGNVNMAAITRLSFSIFHRSKHQHGGRHGRCWLPCGMQALMKCSSGSKPLPGRASRKPGKSRTSNRTWQWR